MTQAKMQLSDWLDDLCVRFIINLPHEELMSVERICFQVEEAQWFYEDFVRPQDPELPSLNLKDFCLHIFQHCPLLSEYSSYHHAAAFSEFLAYKERVPVRGAILLNDDMDRVVLVKGWKKSSSWSFPRGKINKDEPDLDCAVREVYEETGFDLKAAQLVGSMEDSKYVEMTIREQHMRLYIFTGIPTDTQFEPRTRKEISAIQWYKLSELPTLRKQKQHEGRGEDLALSAKKFYMVAPFMVPLKKWILQQKKARKSREKSQLSTVAATESTKSSATNDQPLTIIDGRTPTVKNIDTPLGSSESRAMSDLPEVSKPVMSLEHTSAQLKCLLGIPANNTLNTPIEATRKKEVISDTEFLSTLLRLRSVQSLPETSQIPVSPSQPNFQIVHSPTKILPDKFGRPQLDHQALPHQRIGDHQLNHQSQPSYQRAGDLQVNHQSRSPGQQNGNSQTNHQTFPHQQNPVSQTNHQTFPRQQNPVSQANHQTFPHQQNHVPQIDHQTFPHVWNGNLQGNHRPAPPHHQTSDALLSHQTSQFHQRDGDPELHQRIGDSQLDHQTGPPYQRTGDPPSKPIGDLELDHQMSSHYQQTSSPELDCHNLPPYKRTGDPQFASNSQIPNKDAVSIPTADKLPLPTLTTHSSTLLSLFKEIKPSKVQASVSPSNIEHPDENLLFNLEQIKNGGLHGTPLRPSLVEPRISAKAKSEHRDKLLTLFRPSVMETTESNKNLELLSTLVELSALPSPAHSRVPSKVNTSPSKGELIVRTNSLATMQVRPTKIPKPKNQSVFATVNGPLNVPQFKAVAKPPNENLSATGRSPVSKPSQSASSLMPPGADTKNLSSTPTAQSKIDGGLPLSHILRQPDQIPGSSKEIAVPSPTNPLPLPRHLPSFDGKANQNQDHKKTLLSLFNKTLPTTSAGSFSPTTKNSPLLERPSYQDRSPFITPLASRSRVGSVTSALGEGRMRTNSTRQPPETKSVDKDFLLGYLNGVAGGEKR